MKVSHSMCGPH